MNTKKLRKLKDRAIKLIDKGKYKKALSIYHQILGAFPDDTNIMIKVGELSRKLGMNGAAIAIFANAAAHFAAQGMLLRGIAVCKIILEIDPAHSKTQQQLARLYANKYGAKQTVSEQSTTVDAKQPLSSQCDNGRPTPVKRVLITDEAFRDDDHSIIVDFSHIEDLPEAPLEKRNTKEVSLAEIEIIQADEANINLESGLENGVSDNKGLKNIAIDEIEIEDGEVCPGEVVDLDVDIDIDDADITDIDDIDAIVDTDSLVFSVSKPVLPSQLPEIPLFSKLDEDTFVAMLNTADLLRFNKDDVIVQEGQPGDSFFVILDGSVRVTKKRIQLAVLKEGAFFGEMAIVAPGNRQASVVADETCQILEISNEHLQEIETKYPSIESALAEFTEERLMDNLMLTSPLFTPFQKTERQSLISRFEPLRTLAGVDVIRQNQKADGLYLLVSGQVQVSCQKDDAVVLVATLKGGDIFGEISLLTRSVATATVTTKNRCRLLKLPQNTFNEIIMTHPQILELLSNIGDERKQSLEALLQPELASSTDNGVALL